jgi:hypothetical protein
MRPSMVTLTLVRAFLLILSESMKPLMLNLSMVNKLHLVPVHYIMSIPRFRAARDFLTR